MPRVDPYREPYREYESFPDYEPSASGAMLFVGLVAAIVVAAFLWTTYAPQNATKPGLNPPTISQPIPAEPRPNPPAR